MTTRRIHTSDGSLPPLSLPSGALAKTDLQYHYDVGDEPPAIEPIEHRIRLDFMAGGPIHRSHLLEKYNPWTADPGECDLWREAGGSKPAGLLYAESSCQRTLAEERRYYDRFEVDHSTDLDDVPAFLAHRLQVCREAEDPRAAFEDERARRERWYSTIIPWMNLYHVLKRSSYGSLLPPSVGSATDIDELTEQNAFLGMIVVDGQVKTPVDRADLDTAVVGVEFDITLDFCHPPGPVVDIDPSDSGPLRDQDVERVQAAAERTDPHLTLVPRLRYRGVRRSPRK